MQEILNLVDGAGNRIGTMEKMAVHRTGALHEAFSIFIFDSEGRMMLQKRSRKKYHSPGLWSNTCCGHPRAGEDIISAVHRRLHEEMGFDCLVSELFSCTYRVELSGNLIEHEFDHIFFGRYERDPRPNKKEVGDWKWSTISRIERDMETFPEVYTAWFRILFSRVVSCLARERKNLMLRDYIPVSDALQNLAHLRDERIYRVSNEPLLYK